jgi:hypothetical protein
MRNISWPSEQLPVIVVARSKTWTVVARSNTGIVVSNPTRGMDICMRLFCVCVVLCLGRGLATGWWPYRLWKIITELNKRPGPWMDWKSHWKKSEQLSSIRIIKITVCWNVTTCSLVDRYQRFGVTATSIFRIEETTRRMVFHEIVTLILNAIIITCLTYSLCDPILLDYFFWIETQASELAQVLQNINFSPQHSLTTCLHSPVVT